AGRLRCHARRRHRDRAAGRRAADRHPRLAVHLLHQPAHRRGGVRGRRDPAGGRADWPGTGLITVALTALMFALIRGNTMGWASPAIVALLAVAAVTF